jgi:hypothetical protein
MAYLWTRTALLKEVCEVLAAVTAWPGVVIETDRNGICLTLGGVALGHLSWAGRVDLPFGPEVGERLVAEEMVNRHPIAERFIFDVRTEEDVDRAVWLLRLAYLSTDPKVSTCEHDVAPRPGMRTRRLF